MKRSCSRSALFCTWLAAVAGGVACSSDSQGILLDAGSDGSRRNDSGIVADAGATRSDAADAGDAGSEVPFPPTAVVQIAQGESHRCARFGSGKIKCWGRNDLGQLGLGDTADRGDAPGEMGDALPFVDLGVGRTARAIAAGEGRTCAVLDNGRVKCWGGNGSGQLGLGDTERRGDEPGEMGDSLPYVDLGMGRTAKQIVSASGGYACAVLDNDRVKCWGVNFSGALGLGDGQNRGFAAAQMGDALPYVDLGSGRTVKRIGSSGYHTCVILDNDRVKCWGSNDMGRLGIGDTQTRGDAPGEMGDALPYVDLGAGRTAKHIVVNGLHSCVVLDNDRVKCWGANYGGRLGLGDTADRGDAAGEMGDALPYVDLGAGRTAKTIFNSGVDTCAVLDNSRVKCWGANFYGSVGNGSTFPRGWAPGEMGDALPYVDFGAGRTAKGAFVGGGCAVLDNDQLKCWGDNRYGQLGIGDKESRGDAPGEMGDNLPAVMLSGP